MQLRTLLFCTALALPGASAAQQFVGLSLTNYIPVQQMAVNPAWAAHTTNGVEVHLFSFGILAGSNAYRFSKSYVSAGIGAGAQEGPDYHKDLGKGGKHLWANAEALGPAFAFHIKNDLYGGLYTRMRQIVSGGMNNEVFHMAGDPGKGFPYGQKVELKNNGFTTHIFAEVGLTLGRVLRNDDFHILRGGVTVKYLKGYAAGTILSKDAQLVMNKPDSINSLQGDLHVLYTPNVGPYKDNDISNDIASWFNRAGRGSLGLDIGMQYEYHPEGNPNEPTPYLYSIAVSLTDLGRIGYGSDTGSGDYQLRVKKQASWQYDQLQYESTLNYMGRLMRDSLVKRTAQVKRFHVGLPTALRASFDWNAKSNVYVQVNVLLNLKGNKGEVYKPGYASMLNITPRYETRSFMAGIPFTYVGHQTLTIGLVFRAGPLFFGSSAIISTIILNEVRNSDGYAGVAFRIPKPKRRRYELSF